MEVIEGLKAAEEDVIEKIKSFIMKRSGLYFKEHDMPSLRGKIAERMQATKCSSRWEYYNLLTNSDQAHREFTELLNLLTIKHTHFFRNPDQFIALRDKVLPEIMQHRTRHGDLTLNILSVGCATGEEPYSIAMVLFQLLGKNSPWKVNILATDISTEALVCAKRGIYPIRVLQHIEKDFNKHYMESFCLIHKDKVFVSPAIKNMVEFQYINLIDEYYPHGFDIVFCRNVTIYFEIETVRSVIEKFYQSLNEGGYLFAGGTETMYGISDKFELVELEHALVYKKIPAVELKPAEERVWPWRVEPQIAKIKEETTQISAISAELSALSAVAEPALNSVEGCKNPAKSLKDAYNLYEKAKKNFMKKDYKEAEILVRSALEIEPSIAFAHILLANIFVNQNKIPEAERECRKTIDIDFLSSQPRYLLGIIYKKKAQYREALDNLRKAIYLNNNYSLAHFAIAELYKEKGQGTDALKSYKNTLKSLEAEPEDNFRESSGGITRKALAQVCVKNMKNYQA